MDPSQRWGGGGWAAGGPSDRQKLYASSLQEHDSLFHSYEHLSRVPNPNEGLARLRKIASLVKPIMRKRGWKIQILSEFLPDDPRLLGLNINQTFKICIRLRYTHAPGTLLPIEQTVDTMLHELSHIVWGEHDARFHALWDELRGEYETLVLKGYTGEGFLSTGRKLGGGRLPPPHEMRRLARASAEKRRVLTKGSGQRLGGTPLHRGTDARKVIADAATRRNTIDRGCVSGTAEANELAEQAAKTTFTTKAEEDDANDRAIAEALFDLLEEEEARKLSGAYATPPPEGGLGWTKEGGLFSASGTNGSLSAPPAMSEEEQLKWALEESLRSSGPSSATTSGRATPSGDNDRTSTTAPPPPRPASRPAVSGDQQRHIPRKPVSRLVLEQEAKTRKKRPRSLDNTTITAASPTTSNSSHPPLPSATPPTKPPPSGPLVDLTDPESPKPAPPAPTAPQPFPLPLYTTSDSDPTTWTCSICTCINPLQFLACSACCVERPASVTAGLDARVRGEETGARAGSEAGVRSELGWSCERCGAFMEHRWWSCSGCGRVKRVS
ncbi:hypothetical protein M8818_000858 [Zalaria obscura]|uniref:Uncharacterized protein n=1 Tax=Zalaria obscura TaxID=2024903 RepID=A0ACC3SMK6_9PEZI